MTGLRDTIDDIVAEITPVDPPVELTMLRGRRIRSGRRAAAIGGTAAAVAIVVGAALGVPALTSRGPAGQPVSGTVPASLGDAFQLRPVLLLAGTDAAPAGDVRAVNADVLRLFDRLKCEAGPNAATVDDSWKASVGYTSAAQWNAPDTQVVSCDALGDKYVLGKAAVLGTQVASAVAVYQAATGTWSVDLTLNAAGTAALGRLTTGQYNSYYPEVTVNQDDMVLDQTAVAINGDVQSAPVIDAPVTDGKFTFPGPGGTGFTEAQAKHLAAEIATSPTG
jgi:hypothetical protein